MGRVSWKPCWRVIPTRYPEERLFDRVTEPGDRGVVLALEKMTNERERDAAGELVHVPAAERPRGPGSAYILAALSYRNPEGSRFCDGSFGVYYAARRQETAIAESRRQRELFMRRTKEPPMWLSMRLLTATLDARLHDVRGAASLTASRELAARLRGEGACGLVYGSARQEGGECAAVFRAPALRDCRAAGTMIYQWDGRSIVKVFDVTERSQ